MGDDLVAVADGRGDIAGDIVDARARRFQTGLPSAVRSPVSAANTQFRPSKAGKHRFFTQAADLLGCLRLAHCQMGNVELGVDYHLILTNCGCISD
jgi:hypothetical protein